MRKLAQINHGAVWSSANKLIIVGGQTLLLDPVETLAAYSREVTENAAKRWIRKTELEKQISMSNDR